MADRFYNTEQVAKLYGVAIVTLRKWRIRGEGPRFMRLGKSIRYHQSDLDAFVGGRRFQNTLEADSATKDSRTNTQI